MWHKYALPCYHTNQQGFYGKGITVDKCMAIFPKVIEITKKICIVIYFYSLNEIWVIFDANPSINSENLTLVSLILHHFYGKHMIVLFGVETQYLSMISPDDRDKLFFHANIF